MTLLQLGSFKLFHREQKMKRTIEAQHRQKHARNMHGERKEGRRRRYKRMDHRLLDFVVY